MIEREPSRTAIVAASYRAVHQVLEGEWVFSDRLTVPILGVDAEALRVEVAEHDARRGLRFSMVARARLAEDAVQRAVKTRRVGQPVVLGACLDTYGYQNPLGTGCACSKPRYAPRLLAAELSAGGITAASPPAHGVGRATCKS